jgi:hypothetical protein
MTNASTAPRVADTIETGVPSAVPNSSPLAAASSGPGNSVHVSRAETATKAGTAAAPSGSIASRTRPGEIEPVNATTTKRTQTPAASATSRRRAGPGGTYATPRSTAAGGCAA